jgi:hypothetical protein
MYSCDAGRDVLRDVRLLPEEIGARSAHERYRVHEGGGRCPETRRFAPRMGLDILEKCYNPHGSRSLCVKTNLSSGEDVKFNTLKYQEYLSEFSARRTWTSSCSSRNQAPGELSRGTRYMMEMNGVLRPEVLRTHMRLELTGEVVATQDGEQLA